MTLPKAVRQSLGLRPGAPLVAEVVGGALVLAPADRAGSPFESPPTRDYSEIVEGMRGTGLYSEQFLESMARGMAESEYFGCRK